MRVSPNEMINLGLPPYGCTGPDLDGLREGSFTSAIPHRAFPKLGDFDDVMDAKEAVLSLLCLHSSDSVLLKS